MNCLAYPLEESPIRFISCSIFPCPIPFLQDGFGIVQDEEATRLAQVIKEEGNAFPHARWQVGLLLVGEEGDALRQQALQRGSMVQRAPEHEIELGGHLVYKFDRESSLAKPTPTEQGHQAAPLLDHPLLYLDQFLLAPIKRADVHGLAPVPVGKPVCACLLSLLQGK